MNVNEKLKPCPFCGGKAILYGQIIRDYVNGEWAKKSREEYWVKIYCIPDCTYGMTTGIAFMFCDGIRYTTPEAAIEAWNRRADNA